MNALVRKEIRLLLPLWLAAIAQAMLPALLFWDDWKHAPMDILVYPAFVFGLMLVGLASFGQEFAAGTFSSLLAQPIPRRQLWRTKVRLLAGAMFAVWLSFFLGLLLHDHFFSEQLIELLIILAIITVTVFSSVLWTSLLFRQVSAAFWFSLLVPAMLATMTWSFFHEDHFDTAVQRSENYLKAAVATTLALLTYSAVGYAWARRMFLRAQDVAWTGGVISLPAWSGARQQVQSTIASFKPVRALLLKEFQSHQVTLAIAALLLVTHLIGIGVRKMEHDPASSQKDLVQILGFWWLLWFALPLVIGSTAVAEERKLGTLEGQLCLPARRGTQFTIKLGVSLLLGIFLGGIMPALCEGLALHFGAPGEFPSSKAPDFPIWLITCLGVATGISFISFYASTITRSLLQSLGVAVLGGMALATIGLLVLNQGRFDTPLWCGPLGMLLFVPTVVAALLWLGIRNFRQVQLPSGLWLKNLVAVVAAIGFSVIVTTLIWNRAWEWFQQTEPPHAAAKLTGAVRPEVCCAWGGKIFALLPDGRVWVSTQYEFRDTGRTEEVLRNGRTFTNNVKIPIPTGGVFLADSNWVQLANRHGSVVGLKSDGSIWRIFNSRSGSYQQNMESAPQLEPISTFPDWQCIAAGDRLYALKKDGTLWAWNTPPVPERQSSDTNWTDLFGGNQGIAAGKADGSVWKSTNPSESRSFSGGEIKLGKLFKWYSDVGAAHVETRYSFDLIVKTNGTLWATRNGSPYDLFGPDAPINAEGTLAQVRDVTDVADVKADWNSMVVLKKNGSFFNQNFYGQYLALRGRRQSFSPHSDWIAVDQNGWSESALALAADGTLTAWPDVSSRGQDWRGLLGPSRRPVWTLNILADAH
ncbi:MAG: ABC transporter permease [Verrucomicrobiota bacterium]